MENGGYPPDKLADKSCKSITTIPIAMGKSTSHFNSGYEQCWCGGNRCADHGDFGSAEGAGVGNARWLNARWLNGEFPMG